MSPDQDLRLTCYELALDYAEKVMSIDGTPPLSEADIRKYARNAYRWVLGKDDKVTSAQIPAPHRVVARIRQGIYEQQYEDEEGHTKGVDDANDSHYLPPRRYKRAPAQADAHTRRPGPASRGLETG